MSLRRRGMCRGAKRALTGSMISRALFSAFVLLQGTVTLLATAQERKSDNQAAGQEFTSVIRRFEEVQRSTKPQAAYQVVREYRLSGGGSSRPSSEVLAQVDYLPPSRKTYSIQRRVGSSRGEEAVKRILEHETSLAGNVTSSSSSAITSDNYAFTN